MATLIQDLRFALRSFVRAPRFTIPAILALALGIGATSATLSIVRGVMLEPLPYRDPDRVVTVWETNPGRNIGRNVIGQANFVAWRERQRSFENLGMVGPARLSLMIGNSPAEIEGLFASSDLFSVLGVQPALGRAYTSREDEQGSDQVIIVSHDFWQTRLGGRSDVIGTTIGANGRPRTIVGVMPDGFTVVGQKAAFLIPYGWVMERLRAAQGRGTSYGIARLRDGVTLEQARSDMRNIMTAREKEAPRLNTGWSALLVPVHEQMVEQIRPALLILTGAVLLVLLIACVNVANLLLARSTVRQRELGIRAALGAKRRRLLAQLLSESLLLGAAGGVAGLALAFALHRGLLALVADRIPVPRLDQVALDLPMLGVTMAIALATGLLFGFVPAIITSGSVNESLREGGRHGGGRRSRRILGGLVVAEVAVSLVLLVSAGLLIRSFIRLQNIDPGFRSEGLLTARVQTPGIRYPTPRQIATFYTDALARIAELPGVEQAAGVTFLPMARGGGMRTGFYRSDQPVPAPGQGPSTDVRPVTPNFFKTMGIAQVAGRDFTPADQIDSPRVAIVSEGLVRRAFAGESPIGKRIDVFIGNAGPPYEIIGVVKDIKIASLEGEIFPMVYIPHRQLTVGSMTFVIRTTLNPMSLAPGVTAAVHSLDPELPVADVQPMDDVVAFTIARPRVIMTLLVAFALMAILLAGVGVYGVMAYSVGQRMQEIGVRLAMGATSGMVFRLIIGQAFRLTLIGLVIGLVVAGGVTRVLQALLYETEPRDPSTFGIAALVLLLVAMLASFMPARRGTRMALAEALHPEQ
ncbi:MAG TPA: ABC transporter permease [Vicinamibacterales bacterium]|nr:ABC transporter permease [Vicinamibacterales bacterium]